jgi:NitT/TauT family transport system substrate-binding protein
VSNGKPKPAFYIVVGVVVIALVAFAIWKLSPGPKPGTAGSSEKLVLPPVAGAPTAEHKADDNAPPQPVPEFAKFEIVPSQTLPEVTGPSDFTPLSKTNNTVRFSINTWAGWGPIILANGGFKAGKAWKTDKGNEFKVELVKIDDVVAMRDAYATGQIHIGWATLDMIPLLLETMVRKDGTPRDNRIMPRVFQQIDWSAGGDGIVVREKIKTVADLRGKQIVLTQNSPSEYFALRMLVSGGVQPSEVKRVYTKDPFQAAGAFNAQKELSGCVSWSPDIYNLTKVPGNRLLVTTAQANKIIADVWFARSDFARDHADILESLVRGIFDAMEETEQDSTKEAARKRMAELMAEGYGLKVEETSSMLGDAHNTNWAENREFFLNKNNPANFQRVWETAYAVYTHPQVGAIKHKPIPFDQVMDFTIIDKLGKEEKYSSQLDRSRIMFAPLPISAPDPEGPEIVGNKFYVRFDTNSADLLEKVIREKDGKKVEEYYDPNVDKVLEEIAKFVGGFAAARIIIEGHTDSTQRGRVPAADLPEVEAEVKRLSEKRAAAVKEALVQRYKFDPNQLTPRGMGWNRPADPANPNNQALNRRVEVRVYSAEK